MSQPLNNIQWFPIVPARSIETEPRNQTHGVAKRPGAVDHEAVEPTLTPLALYLHKQGLDFGKSSTTANAASFSFQLAYSASESEQLSASGSYSTQTQTLSLDLRMMFQTEEAVEDGTKIHHFEANLQVELSQIQGHSIQPYVKKEDIVSFVRRLLEKISELVADDGQDLAGVVLDLEDFQDIVALDNGKLAELLSNLIQMVVTQAQMKRILDGGEEPVLLAPQREAISGVETYNYLRQVRRFRFTVKEVTEEKPPDTMDLEDILSANDSADVIKEDRPASTEA